MPKKSGVNSAILLPVYRQKEKYHLLFNLRTREVLHHKGQISFPGGARETRDPDALHTALREAEEEIGLDPGQVQVLGRLDDVLTITGYLISPFVGLIPYPYPFKRNQNEVAEIFGLAMDRLMEPDDYREDIIEVDGHELDVPYFLVQERMVWGATGRIVKNFLQTVFGWTPPG
ncbi:MAG: CoA pyrophosphatase [Deltaproteobacteria bacterium]|nr:CoA pyrophosphatase [Deltaproteobacteria bacterium]